MNPDGPGSDALAPSCLRLRKTVGWIGMLSPFALYLGNRFADPNFHPLWPYSISGYYHTHMRSVFLIAAGAIAALLIAYRGYDKADRWLTNGAGLLTLGVAFCPTTPTRPPFYHGPPLPSGYQRVLGDLHMVFAVALFITLAVVALRFTSTGRGDPDRPSAELRRLARELWYSPPGPGDSRGPRKRKRDAVYRVCARLMLAAIALAAVTKVLPAEIYNQHAVFFIEAVAVFCFGLSWFVKGQGLLADPPPGT